MAQLVVAEEKLRKMKEDSSWMKDLAMGKYSGQGDFAKGLSDARSVRFNTTLDDMVRDGKDVAKSGSMLLSDKAMAVVTKQIKEATKPSKDDKKEIDVFGQMNQGISSIVGGLSQLGVELPEGLTKILSGIQAVTTVLTGISALVTIITAIQGAKATPVIGFLMARGGIVPHAANGYYVPGNHYSNDVTPVMANAGELILNKAAQGNLASQLNGGGLGNLHLETIVSGRDLRIVLNNESQGRLKGKYVTSNKA